MFVVPPLGQSLKGLGNVGRSQQSLKPKREDECAHGFNMLNTYINIYIIYVHYYALSISTIIYNIYIYIMYMYVYSFVQTVYRGPDIETKAAGITVSPG